MVRHDQGICHLYIDAAADLEKATAIAVNAKAQRPGVCNALETLLVDAAVARINERLSMRRGEWAIRVHVETELTADAQAFHLKASLSAHEGLSGELVFTGEWDETIARDCV